MLTKGSILLISRENSRLAQLSQIITCSGVHCRGSAILLYLRIKTRNIFEQTTIYSVIIAIKVPRRILYEVYTKNA